MNLILIHIVAIDDKGFIRAYREFDPRIEDIDTEIAKYVHGLMRDKNVQKLEVKKWYE